MNVGEVEAALREAVKKLGSPSPPQDEGARNTQLGMAFQAMQPLAAMLEKESVFANKTTFVTLLHSGGGLDEVTAGMAIYHCMKTGQFAETAAALESLCNRDEQVVRLSVPVFGLTVPVGGFTVAGVNFRPWSERPFSKSSENFDFELESVRLGSRRHPHSIAFFDLAPRQVVCDTASSDPSIEKDMDLSRATSEEIHRIASLFSLVTDSATRIGQTWDSFANQDLEALRNSFSGYIEQSRHDHRGTELTLDDIDFVVRAQLIDKTTGKRFSHAAQRLAFARSRGDILDRCVEVGIALETLVLDEKTELKFRLRLRTSQLLGQNHAERVAISGDIGKLYDLRSSRVHGKVPPARPDHQTDQEVLHSGLAIAQRVAQRLVKEGRFPEWPVVELAGPADLQFPVPSSR